MINLYNNQEKKYFSEAVFVDGNKLLDEKEILFTLEKESAYCFSNVKEAENVAKKLAWYGYGHFVLIGESEEKMYLQMENGEEKYIKWNEKIKEYEVTEKIEEAVFLDDVSEAWEIAYECAYLGLGRFYCICEKDNS
ncbi:hypothetical protein [Enterococcus sp. C76]|uniref:hypothetical protein n=1 Tax=Enterococcus sp. C76 TaxID=3231334 RepID=UPI0034A065D8